jgi:hypothetical protein
VGRVTKDNAGSGRSFPGALAPKLKLQHWRAFPGKNGWKGPPMLEFAD